MFRFMLWLQKHLRYAPLVTKTKTIWLQKHRERLGYKNIQRDSERVGYKNAQR